MRPAARGAVHGAVRARPPAGWPPPRVYKCELASQGDDWLLDCCFLPVGKHCIVFSSHVSYKCVMRQWLGAPTKRVLHVFHQKQFLFKKNFFRKTANKNYLEIQATKMYLKEKNSFKWWSDIFIYLFSLYSYIFFKWEGRFVIGPSQQKLMRKSWEA